MKIRKTFLNENYLLEAFSPSMPEWLQNYIMFTGAYGKRGNKLSKSANPEYDRFRYSRDTGRGSADVARDILNGYSFPNYGQIDFSKANFISAPVPSKVDDPIFTDISKVCFVYLKSEYDKTVWVPRFSSESEKFILDNGKEIAMKYFNSKQLKEYGKDMCYIDINDPNNFKGEKVKERAQAKAGSVERRRNVSASDWDVQRGNIDKSGYVRIPSARRLEDKLRELKIKKLPENVEATRNAIVQLQKDLNRAENLVISNISANPNSFDYSTRNDLLSSRQSFNRALSTYQELLQSADDLTNNKAMDDYTKRWKMNDIINKLNNIESYLKDCSSYIDKYLPTSIDWNEFDDSIYTDDEFDID